MRKLITNDEASLVVPFLAMIVAAAIGMLACSFVCDCGNSRYLIYSHPEQTKEPPMIAE